MGQGTPRRVLWVAAIAAISLAACQPVVEPAPPAGGGGGGGAAPAAPPPPPPPVWCQSEPTPGATDQVAVVDTGGSRPEVVEFDAATAAEVQTEVDALEQQGDVLAVGPEATVSAQAYPQGSNPSYATSQWSFGAAYVNFAGAWNATPSATGSGVRVAIIDTGVEASHPDLAARVVQGRDFVLADESQSNYGRIDGFGHGTHVAGIVAASDDANGVVGGALDATIVPVRVLNCSGSGSNTAVANGIMWAADPTGGHVDVINLSLGGPSDFGGVLASAIDYALDQNVVVVASAGNCGAGGSGSQCPGGVNSINYPAALAGDQVTYPGMIAVGATDSNASGHNPFARASYSNANTYVTVAAPGTSIYSTYAQQPSHTPTYTTLSGTSMATPEVAAVAALIKSKCGFGAYTAAQVRTRVLTGTQAVNGFQAAVGMVNAVNATAAC